MRQPADRAEVVSRARRIVGEEGLAAALELLDRYGTEPWHREKERVQLAVLALLEADPRASLEELVEAACFDYRDVLLWVESVSGPRGTR